LQQIDYLIVESLRLDVYDQPGLLRRSLRDETGVIAAHQAVVRALAERDGEQASRAMRAHLDRLLQTADIESEVERVSLKASGKGTRTSADERGSKSGA